MTKANEGREFARSAILEWLTREGSRVVEPSDNEVFWRAYRKAMGDVVKLIEQTDPLEIWETDCRKGHKQWGNKTRNATVLLDGVKLQFCVAADSVAEAAMVHRRTDGGKPVYKGGDFVMDIIYGKVEIVEPVKDILGKAEIIPEALK